MITKFEPLSELTIEIHNQNDQDIFHLPVYVYPRLNWKGGVVFRTLRNEWSEKQSFHTELWEWDQVCRVSSGHMVFHSSVVFVVISHFLACPTHPPYVCFVSCFGIFLSSAIVLVVIFHCIKSQFLVSRILALLCCNACDLRCWY